VNLDLRWLKPCVSVAPGSLSVTLDVGSSTTLPLTLTNAGAAATSFELAEKPVAFQPQAFAKPLAAPQLLVPPAQANARSTQGLGLPPAPASKILAAGEVIQSWRPTSQSSAWGLTYTSEDSVWVGNGWGPNTIYEYTPGGTPTGRSWPYSWNPSYGPADDTFNWNTGMVWTLDVGGGDCLHEMDPGSGYTGNTICGPWGISQRGLAYDPSTDTWFAGGWNEGIVYHIDSSGTLLESANVGLAVAGLAYNPDTGHLFVMVNDAATVVYVLDVAAGYAVVGQFSVGEGFTAFAGAGLEFDCDGNLWAVDQSTNTVYEFQSGETASLCAEDVRWLSEEPITGTLPADGGSQPVAVTFTAWPTMPLGVYTATLRAKTDDPVRRSLEVQAVLHVTMTPQVTIGPDTAGSDLPGEMAAYVLTLTNTGNYTDSFTLAVTGNTWTTTLSAQGTYRFAARGRAQNGAQGGPPPCDTCDLPAGATAGIIVLVQIPDSATVSDWDAATITAASVRAPNVTASATVTTTVLMPDVSIKPSNQDGAGLVGEAVIYTLTVTNLGNLTERYNLEAFAETWPTTLSITVTGDLAPGASVDVVVAVAIPHGVMAGEADMAAIVVSSVQRPSVKDAAVVRTTAHYRHLYVPLLLKNGSAD
jgi:hypothetical protein